VCCRCSPSVINNSSDRERESSSASLHNTTFFMFDRVLSVGSTYFF
jgi:hypothetical protein